MTEDALDLVLEDHRLLLDLLERCAAAPEARRRRLLRELAAAMTAHAVAEEVVLYPRLLAADGGAGAGRAVSQEALAAHHDLQPRLRALLDADPVDPGTLEGFAADVRRHLEAEERDVLPAAAKVLTEEERRELGARMRARRKPGTAPRAV